MKKRLKKLEEKAAKEGILYTEAQIAALEVVKREKVSNPEKTETHQRTKYNVNPSVPAISQRLPQCVHPSSISEETISSGRT